MALNQRAGGLRISSASLERNGSQRLWLGVFVALTALACSSEPPRSELLAATSSSLTEPSCSDVPSQYLGADDGCDCPADGNTSCDSDCTEQGNAGGEWCGCQYCYEPGEEAEPADQCEFVPPEFVDMNDGCDCPVDGDTSCDPDCTEHGNPGGASCGCQYCYDENGETGEDPPPSGTSCDDVPDEYVGVHDGCDCPADGDTSCDPDCQEGNIADDHCGCQFCYGGDGGGSSDSDQFSVELPARMTPPMVAVLARRSLDVGEGAEVRRGPRGYGRVVNTGSEGTSFGAGSRVGDTWSACPVHVDDDAEINGTVYTTGPVTPGADVQGGIETVPVLPDPEVHSWEEDLPERTGGDRTIAGGTTLAPGGYGDVTVTGSGVVRLVSGVYHVGDFAVADGGSVEIDDSDGPVVIYVDGGVEFDGDVTNADGDFDPDVDVLIVVYGGGVVRFGGPFTGTVYAPESSVSLESSGTPGYHGSYFGNDVALGPGVVLWHVPFPWSGVLPDARRAWNTSAVHLGAWVDNESGDTHSEEVNLDGPVNFVIPPMLPVRNGNAGNGTALLRFREGNNPIATCTYRGAGVPNPTTDVERLRGLIYEFEDCDDGSVAGQRVRVDWVELEVLGGDSDDPAGQTEASLDSGDGCSAYIPPPLHPWEVADLKQGFSWTTVDELAETDPDGNPALWHGLVYIENREQLAALDRLRVFWSARPLSAAYNEQMRGLCGRVEHATDGIGVVVYAVFPARLFNLLRGVGIQAENDGIPPPYRFIIPSSPDPEYTNADGSIAYEALASSGFQLWLAERSQLSPGFWSKVTKPFKDAVKWVDDNLIDPITDAGQSVYHYTIGGFDELIDTLVPLVDDIWELTQEALAEFVFLIDNDVSVDLDVRLENLDDLFPEGSYLVRAWGPPCTTDQTNRGLCGGENLLTAPALAVLAIFSVVWRWNDFLWPLIVLSRKELYTLQVGLSMYSGELNVQWHFILAMTVVTMIPVVLVFIFLQRFITTGIAGAGLK
jgi:hypothetical protein